MSTNKRRDAYFLTQFLSLPKYVAVVAQLVERILGRDEVCGPIPHNGSGKFKRYGVPSTKFRKEFEVG